MNVRSLSYRTDLMFARFDGEVVDRGAHTFVSSPANPGYWWGNFVLFAQPPGAGDLPRWKTVFATEFGRPGEAGHIAFGIDGTKGEAGAIQPFLDDGFRLERGVVLASREVHEPPRPHREVRVRPLRYDVEWAAATANQLRDAPEGQDSETFRRFKTTQMLRYRAMSRAGRGDWFGAFLGETLVADLGVFHEGAVGRFQSVGTHPDHRRRGICGTLLHHAARHALRSYGIDLLVIVADEGSGAARIYESVGLAPREITLGLVRPERPAS